MDKLYKILLDLSKSGNMAIQSRARNKDLLNQVKAIIDQKKINAKSNIYSQVDTARLWMEEFTGLDKVHAAQNDVFHYQNEFIKSQTKRRELGTKLTSLQMELNDLHSDIVTTNRSDEKYLHYITREHKLLKLENQLRNDFGLIEAEERENFTLFTTKIKESQDKEREQALRTKYWTIIVSSAVTLIGVLGNGVISFLKMHKIDSTIQLLGEDTQSLSRSLHADIAHLDVNQSRILGILSQTLSDQTGVKPSENLVSEALATLDSLQKSKDERGGELVSPLGGSQLAESASRQSKPASRDGLPAMLYPPRLPSSNNSSLPSLEYSSVLPLLRQIASDVQALSKVHTELRSEMVVDRNRLEALESGGSSWGSGLYGAMASVGGGMTSLGSRSKEVVGGLVQRVQAYVVGGGEAAKDGEARGNELAEDVGGKGKDGIPGEKEMTETVEVVGKTGHPSSGRGSSSVAIVKTGGSGVREVSNEGGRSWGRTVLYFGVFTWVVVMLGGMVGG